jgi:hypothetical protein
LQVQIDLEYIKVASDGPSKISRLRPLSLWCHSLSALPFILRNKGVEDNSGDQKAAVSHPLLGAARA